MIFPILSGFLPFRKIPITWILVAANVFIFSQNLQLGQYSRHHLQHWYTNADHLQTQGHVYAQYLKKNNDRSLASVKSWETLGQLAFQNENFLHQASKMQWVGDQVAIQLWKHEVDNYFAVRDFYPAFLFGVGDGQKSYFSYWTYQFFHEGFMHLFGNLLLVFLIGGFLESRWSGSLVFVTYLLSGFFSAMAYTTFLGAGSAPLIGASGSLCGLMGLFFVLHFYEKTNVYYFILPMEGYYGTQPLRTAYWAPWLFVLEDLAGWLARPELFLGGVSHFVHLSGFVVGMILGGLLLVYRELWSPPGVTSH